MMALFDWDLETNEIYYSPVWKSLLGYEDNEIPNDFSVWGNPYTSTGCRTFLENAARTYQ